MLREYPLACAFECVCDRWAVETGLVPNAHDCGSRLNDLRQVGKVSETFIRMKCGSVVRRTLFQEIALLRRGVRIIHLMF